MLLFSLGTMSFAMMPIASPDTHPTIKRYGSCQMTRYVCVIIIATTVCPMLCVMPPSMLVFIMEMRENAMLIIRKLSIHPDTENIKEVTLPKTSRVKRQRQTSIMTIYRFFIKWNANTVTSPARPIFMPGIKANDEERMLSIYESAKESAIKTPRTVTNRVLLCKRIDVPLSFYAHADAVWGAYERLVRKAYPALLHAYLVIARSF